MSDFTLPINDEKRRKEAINSYKRQIAAAAHLVKLNENVRMPDEEVIVSARLANKMAFELLGAGEYTDDEWKNAIKPFEKYLPKRPYERSPLVLEALADRARQMESISQ